MGARRSIYFRLNRDYLDRRDGSVLKVPWAPRAHVFDLPTFHFSFKKICRKKNLEKYRQKIKKKMKKSAKDAKDRKKIGKMVEKLVNKQKNLKKSKK